MQNPEVKFVYPRFFNSRIKEWLSDPDWYPTHDALREYMGSLQKLWSERGDEVMSIIAKRIGVPWADPQHTCYIIGVRRGLSSPLAIGYLEDDEKGFDHLTHEMIHRYYIQDDRSLYQHPGWKKLMDLYAKETETTRNHIPVHALHKHVYLKMDRRDRLEKEIANLVRDEYKRAWEIVQAEGEEKILDFFSKN